MANFDFDVFLSYAHDEASRPFARTLKKWLEDASFKVWLDEEQVPAGEDPLVFIPAAAQTCRHAVLILSGESLRRDWPRYEQNLFAVRRQQEGECRLVPVVRLPGKADLGPHLSLLAPVRWPDGAPDGDARFWEVVCGLRRQAPGPVEEWAGKGRAARGLSARAEAGDTSARDAVRDRFFIRGDSRFLQCDRFEQWGVLDGLASTPESLTILVPGSRGQGHEYFRLRVLTGYPARVPFTTAEVSWRRRPPFPKTRGEFHAALARALRCGEGDLVAAMKARLADRHLVLLHDVVADGFADREPLVRYYCEYLPELLAEVSPEKSVKCIQPIEWIPGKTLPLVTRLLNTLWPGGPWGSRLATHERDARALLAEVGKGEVRTPRIIVLKELKMIRIEHVLSFFDLVGVPKDGREPLAEMIMHGARSAQEVLDNLAKHLPEREDR